MHQLLRGKNGIAVAGTHGKSTTTALLATMLVEAQRDPTVIVGTRLRLFENTNARTGKGNDVLVEADEYNQGILLYRPNHAVVLNVDHEHVDVYPTIADAQQAFATFVSHVAANGSVTLNADDPSTALLTAAAQAPVRTFGLGQADAVARDISYGAEGTTFTISGLFRGVIHSRLFGEHNVRNVLAAACVAHALNISFEVVQRAVAAFPGTWRRFEHRGEWHGATVIDDYAHHPTEVAATLQAARQAFPGRRLVCVFQPHLHSRTIAFAKAFVAALQRADWTILLPIEDVVGREGAAKTSSQVLADAMGNTATTAGSLPNAVRLLDAGVRVGDVILSMGAGSVTTLFEELEIRNVAGEAQQGA